MHRLAMALLALLLLLPAPTLAADRLVAIDVVGNRSLSADSIRARLPLRIGDAYDAAHLDQAIQTLYATGLFADVRVNGQSGRVTVAVVENPIVASVAIEGNASIETSQLLSLLTLKQRSRYTAAKAHADALRVRDYYRAQGRQATSVTPRTRERPDGQLELVHVVAEAEVAKVARIAFAGNRAFSDQELKGVVTTSESGWLDILKRAAFYDAERLRQDAELLRRYYRTHGFPDAKVGQPEAVETEDGKAYRVTFTIDEGVRYGMRAGSIDSRLRAVDTRGLTPVRKLADGAAYDEEAIERSVEDITLALSRQGFAFARVKTVPVRDERTQTIRIDFVVTDGPAFYAERIDIAGNTKTRDEVIRRELRIAEGDPVNALLLERARKRVMALGFFKSVDLKRHRGSADDKLVLTVEVVEDDSRNIGFGIGYSTAEGVVGDLNLGEKNLLGTGQRLGVKLSGSASRLQAELGFTEPRFLGSSVAAGFDLFYKDIDYAQYASYKGESVGFKLRASYPVDDTWTVGVNYGYSRSTLYDIGANASPAIKQAVPGYPNATSTAYDTSSLGYSVAYDTRDSKRRPTSGVVISLSQDLAGLGGDVRYIRTGTDLKTYHAVADGVTAQLRAAGGTIVGWGGQDVRLLDLYYKGNDIVRGFAPAGIGPRDASSANADALGGKSYFTTSSELLFAIPGVPRDIGLKGAIFADVGSLWSANRSAAAASGTVGSAFVPRASVGVGLGWDSPIGTLRVDYAIPLAKQSFDKTQPLSFGLSPF
ncbi:MAG: outer membrane protein assembly factor BamA [Hyphomicrobiaceae bacterium]|nr:outer membrane protein assembly factor BamA [Hyphomicrobiaceae bacterium]